MFGIALDLYWKQQDEGQLENKKQSKISISSKKKIDEKRIFDLAIKAIQKEGDVIVLNELRDNLVNTKLYSKEHQQKLLAKIDEKIKRAQN